MSKSDENKEAHSDRLAQFAKRAHRLNASPDPMVELAAEQWHEAEREAGNGRLPWAHLSEEERVASRKRAALVLAGEVKWSETGPGDRAIWEGRRGSTNALRRATARIPRLAATDPALRDKGREIRWWNVYDTLVIVPGKQHTNPPYVRLFGNANIGNARLTNLQCAGMPAYDTPFAVADMYVTCRTDRDPEAAADLLDHALLTLVIGEHHDSPYVHAADAALDRCPVDALIPVRQNFCVNIDYIPLDLWTRIQHPLELVVHLDGAICRWLY